MIPTKAARNAAPPEATPKGSPGAGSKASAKTSPKGSPHASPKTPIDLRGQAKVIHEVRELVDAWRGYALGRAADPCPKEPPRYEAIEDGERPLTETSLALLHH